MILVTQSMRRKGKPVPPSRGKGDQHMQFRQTQQPVDWMKVLQAVSLLLGIVVAIRNLNE
jgi:hypothetical protein